MITPHTPLRPRIQPIWSVPGGTPWLVMGDANAPLRRHARGGLIVDMDDTLYPREQFVVSGFGAVARYVARAYDVSREAAFATLTRAHGGPQRGREFQTLCHAHHLPLSIVGELIDVFREHRPSLSLAAGVEQTLKALRCDGWRIAILTNGLPSVQASKVAALDLPRIVDHVLYAECHARGGKPAVAAFQAALQRLALPAESCLCVGDDVVCDIYGAHGAGIRAIQLVPKTGTADASADAVIHAFEDLPVAAASLVNLVTIDVA
jgi:putative hydrolase of the HAD superfamily